MHILFDILPYLGLVGHLHSVAQPFESGSYSLCHQNIASALFSFLPLSLEVRLSMARHFYSILCLLPLLCFLCFCHTVLLYFFVLISHLMNYLFMMDLPLKPTIKLLILSVFYFLFLEILFKFFSNLLVTTIVSFPKSYLQICHYFLNIVSIVV